MAGGTPREPGTGPDGKRLRRHVEGRTPSEVGKRLDKLKKDREAGVGTGTRNPTVVDWTRAWLELVERTRSGWPPASCGSSL